MENILGGSLARLVFTMIIMAVIVFGGIKIYPVATNYIQIHMGVK
jgi:hypothetical protein